MGFIFSAHFLKYAALPGFKSRLEDLFFTGFQFITYCIALVYGSANLLPANHPYLNPANIGRFGIRHVIAEAANHLVFKRSNIDQILLFITILIGLVVMIIQICLLGAGFFIQPVLAAMPTSFAGFFITPNPSQDIAYMMLDLVFGVPDMFNSCVSKGVCIDASGSDITVNQGPDTGESVFRPHGFPFPIHQGLHQMFFFYNTGLLVVATLIALYFMVTIVAETAQSGTAFGKRFNKVWAPIRIVFAFGLLVPVGYGMNGSQYAVLYAAKFGSGFATNGWTLFNETLTGAYGSALEGMMISTPNIPEIGSLLQFFYIARTCAHIEKAQNNRDIDMFLVKGPQPSGTPNAIKITDVTGSGSSYEEMIKFADQSARIIIRFGIQSEEDFGRMKGYVNPYCGEVTMRLTDPRDPEASDTDAQPETGTLVMQRYYWYILKEMWFQALEGSFAFPPLDDFDQNYPKNIVRRLMPKEEGDSVAEQAPIHYKTAFQDFYRNDIRAAMLDPGSTGIAGVVGSSKGAIKEQEESGRFTVDSALKDKGWAGAAIWYNRVAEMNGAMTTAVLNIPTPTKYTDVMEHVQRKKNQQDQIVMFDKRFEPVLAEGKDSGAITFAKLEDAQAANAYWEAFKDWQEGAHVSTSHSAPTGNVVIDAINALFGTEGLYNIRNNQNVHPLAQLVGVGRSLVESSIRNLTVGVVGGAAGGIASIIDKFIGKAISIPTTFIVTFAMVGLTAGFILFYVVPFLPFIYFFFALGGWIKGIFEAMVGAPLWALAHIRIDGNGLPGQAAVNGYFLIFEIFIRPILIIFGILASISIFSALVTVLNQTFDLVTNNLAGFDHHNDGDNPDALQFARSQVDQFFFTIVYTIIVYLMAMSSFKLIDLIPNNILRWMGQSVATFNDQREDAAQGLVGKATVGSQQTTSALGGGLKSIAGAGGAGG
ncbi:MAG: DotA/TraY family protein [Bdellovibrionales bacterium]